MSDPEFGSQLAPASDEAGERSVGGGRKSTASAATPLSSAIVPFVLVGGLAGLALVAAEALSLRPWALFLAWVGYGVLAGALAKGLKFLGAFTLGAGAGMATVLLGAVWQPWLGVAALPVALGLGCGVLAALDKLPPLNIVPVYFLGMIAFFASAGAPSVELLVSLAASAALGITWGFVAITLQRALEKRFAAS